MSIETIIAEAITDGTTALEDALTIAGRVKAVLQAASLLVETAPAYEPQAYPKWVGTRIVHSEEEEKALTAPVAWEEPVAPAAEPEPKAVSLEAAPVEAESGHSAALEPAAPPHEAPATT
jgi:hypothetical protein